MNTKHTFGKIPERFLRQIWRQQLFDTSSLTTADGRNLVILSPGALNTDGGPDFKNARVQIGGTLFRGDIELHRSFQDWEDHTHHLNSRYNSVILHVVFEGTNNHDGTHTKSKRALPLLCLTRYLTTPFKETWYNMITGERAERLATIPCYRQNEHVQLSIVQRWLEKLALERTELKVRRFEERLKELVNHKHPVLKEPHNDYDDIPFGINPEDLPPPVHRYSKHDFASLVLWNQLLYEGLMEALGYSKNQEAFLKLSRIVTLEYCTRAMSLSDHHREATLQAVLFGTAGLLPVPANGFDTESKLQLKTLRTRWKRIRTAFPASQMYEAEWQFFRLRPENFPTVRLAGAVPIIIELLDNKLFRTIMMTLKNSELDSRRKLSDLRKLFTVSSDRFWSTHFRFGEQTEKPTGKNIGRQRSDDIILNVVIPVALLYGRVFKDKTSRAAALKVLYDFPITVKNTITDIMDKQLFRNRWKPDSALLQQGVLQLYKMYCIENRCLECEIGKNVFRAHYANLQ